MDHLIGGYAEGLTLFDQNLDMPRDAGIDQLVADFTDVRREQIAVAREDSLMTLVNDQVKIIHFHRIAVPVPPEQLDCLEGQLAGFQSAHECAAEDLFIPKRVHSLFDLIGKS